jgi:hypothetical protein
MRCEDLRLISILNRIGLVYSSRFELYFRHRAQNVKMNFVPMMCGSVFAFYCAAICNNLNLFRKPILRSTPSFLVADATLREPCI